MYDLSELPNQKNAYTQKSKELEDKSVKVCELNEKVSFLQQKLNKKDVRNLDKKLKEETTILTHYNQNCMKLRKKKMLN